MYEFVSEGLSRPKTVQHHKKREKFRQYYQQYPPNPEEQAQAQQYFDADSKQFASHHTSQGFYNHNKSRNTPHSTTNIVYLSIPKQQLQNEEVFRKTHIENRGRLYSRENMQVMNSKYRQIRSSRYGTSHGLYDVQNDRRVKKAPNIIPRSPDKLILDFQPMIKSMKSSEQAHRKLDKKKRADIKVYKKNVQRNNSNTQNNHNESPLGKSDIFIPEKQSETGMILHQFQSNLKKRRVEDNLYVMASVLKRKLKVLEKKEVIQYVTRLMSRDNNV